MTTVVDWQWEDTAAGAVLRHPDLATLAPHAFTSRSLEFRREPRGDYEALAELFGRRESDVVRVRQVHGRVVIVARPGDAIPDSTEADAIVSTDPDRVISVRVADCVPILLADGQRRVVAAIHAGWKGTCAGIVSATIEAIEDLGVPPSDLIAAIGPSIGPCCYQVDARVRTAFLAVHPEASSWMTEDGIQRWKLDLWTANHDQLVTAGIPPEAISASRICTADHLDRCYSYRAEGDTTGRMVAAIGFLAS